MIVENASLAIGPAVGLLAASFPLIFLASNLSELVYQHFGWQHESAHELLTSMSSVDGIVEKVLAVVAAVVLAPLSEELLFRGHIQGGIRQMFLSRIKRPRVEAAVTQPEAVVASPSDAAFAPAVIPYASPVLEYTPAVASSKTLMASAVSIVLTSMLFAAVHPAWSRAPIFVLSLFLGFAYERKGNIWTNIFMHAMFNGIMVTLYLSLPQPPA